VECPENRSSGDGRERAQWRRHAYAVVSRTDRPENGGNRNDEAQAPAAKGEGRYAESGKQSGAAEIRRRPGMCLVPARAVEEVGSQGKAHSGRSRGKRDPEGDDAGQA